MTDQDTEALSARLHAVDEITAPSNRGRIGEVQRRIRTSQRRRRAAGALAASALAAASVVVVVNLLPAHPLPAPAGVTSITAAPALHVTLTTKTTQRANRSVALYATITGTSSTTATFGWIITWGDGGLDRSYGTTCPPTRTATPVNDQRTFTHTYPSAGPYTIYVQARLCGADVKDRTLTLTVR